MKKLHIPKGTTPETAARVISEFILDNENELGGINLYITEYADTGECMSKWKEEYTYKPSKSEKQRYAEYHAEFMRKRIKVVDENSQTG